MGSKKEKSSGCLHPEKLKGKPGDCTPEQIKECHGESHGKGHGDAKEHPCATPESS